MDLWTSLVVVATSLLALHGGAHVIRHEDVDAPEAALNDTSHESAFNKHWQGVLGDSEHTYKKHELGSLDLGNVFSALDQNPGSKEKIYNAEFGVDAGSKAKEDKVKEEKAKEDILRNEYGEEYVDKEENLLDDGVVNNAHVIEGDKVKEDGLKGETPAQHMDNLEDKLDEDALKEDAQDDIVKERHTEADGLEGETPEEYMDKQENELEEDEFDEKDEEDNIEKEEDAKENIMKEAYKENGSNSEGQIAKEIAKLYAMPPKKENKPEETARRTEETPGGNSNNNTESTGLVTRGEQLNEKPLKGTAIELTYDDNIDGLNVTELNGDQGGRREEEDETVVNDQTKATTEGTVKGIKGGVNATLENNKTQATNVNENLNIDDQDIIEYVAWLFDDGVGNTTYQQSGKEKGDGEAATSKVDGGSLAEGELGTKKETDVKNNTGAEKAVDTSENKQLKTVEEEIVELTFLAGGETTLDQQNGEGEVKEVDEGPLGHGELDAKKAVENTEKKAKATGENEKLDNDGQTIIEIVEVTFGDGGNKTLDQLNGKEQEEKENGEGKEEKTEDKAKATSEKEKLDKYGQGIIEIVEVMFGDGGEKTSDQEKVNGKEEEAKEGGGFFANIEVNIENGDVKTEEKINKEAKSMADVESTSTPDKAIETSVKEETGTNTAEMTNPEEAATLKTNNDTAASRDETNKNAEDALLSAETDRNGYGDASVPREVREARYSAPWSKTSDSPAWGQPHVNIERISRPGWTANLVTSDGPSNTFLTPLPVTRQWSSGPSETHEGRNMPGYVVNEKVVQRSYVSPSVLGKPSDMDDPKNAASNPDDQGLVRSDTDQGRQTPVTSPASKLSQWRNDDKTDLDQNLEAQSSRFYSNSLPGFDEYQQLNYLKPSVLSNPPSPSFSYLPAVPALVPLPVMFPVVPLPFPFFFQGSVPALKPPTHQNLPSCSLYGNDNSYSQPQW